MIRSKQKFLEKIGAFSPQSAVALLDPSSFSSTKTIDPYALTENSVVKESIPKMDDIIKKQVLIPVKTPIRNMSNSDGGNSASVSRILLNKKPKLSPKYKMTKL